MRIQRSREKDESDHPRGYRTHLIFAGKRDPEASGQNVVSQSGSHYYGAHSTSHSYSSHSNHPFAHAPQQQQLRPHHQQSHHPPPEPARRKGSRNVMMDDDTYRHTGGGKQVSFGQSSGNNYHGGHIGSLQPSPNCAYGAMGHGMMDESDRGKPGMLEVVAGLSRDCFIIPLACVDRFLPAGLSLPVPDLSKSSRSNNNTTSTMSMGSSTPLSILEVADPQLAVVVHLMTPLMPLNPPALESPMSTPERIQRQLAMELLQKAAGERHATHGLLLASMETSSDFPLMTLYVVPKLRTDASDFVENARKNALDVFDPSNLGYCGDHFFHLCREVATIARPPIDNPAKKGKASTTGYIISIFRVFDGDDREKLERNWLYWTGARTLYRHLPKSVGLRRITLHKSAAVRGDKLYLLLCECANFLENVNSAAQLLPALRARLCGYTGIYRVAAAF